MSKVNFFLDAHISVPLSGFGYLNLVPSCDIYGEAPPTVVLAASLSGSQCVLAASLRVSMVRRLVGSI